MNFQRRQSGRSLLPRPEETGVIRLCAPDLQYEPAPMALQNVLVPSGMALRDVLIDYIHTRAANIQMSMGLY